MSRIEKACAVSEEVRCEVVTLYNGGEYNLYRYRRYDDVRLVFAPEFAIAFFGGDPDNFDFPRYDLDMSFLRIYQGGKPADTAANYLRFSRQGVKEGDLVFTSGHPGSSSRRMPTSMLKFERDTQLPTMLMWMSEARGILDQFQLLSPEHKRISGPLLFRYENSIKARRGMREALVKPKFFGALIAREVALRRKVEADPELKKIYGGAWDALKPAVESYKTLWLRHALLEQRAGTSSDLLTIARDLVRLSVELDKPNEKRLREYTDAALPGLKARLFSSAPIYDDLEITTLAFWLAKVRADLGADDPFVKRVLARASPREVATALVKGTRLKDIAQRQALFKGGAEAIGASADPLIRFAREVDLDAREVRRIYEAEVEGPVERNKELIAKAYFAVFGKTTYPDATDTLRLSYGTVRGWTKNGKAVRPLTVLGGAFERATGREPFELPKTWIAAKPKLDLATPFNLTTDNDILGGNSGSPLIDKNGEAVGLVFDGNLDSLAGDYGYEESNNRCVVLHTAAILEALDKIYGAKRVVEELRP